MSVRPLLNVETSYESRGYVWDIGQLAWVAEQQSSITGGGDASAANQSTEITRLTSLLAELQLKADLTETQPVSVATLPLPSGAATSAKQDTGNTSIASIDGKLPAQIDSRIPITTGINDAQARNFTTDPVFPIAGLNSTLEWVALSVLNVDPVGTEYCTPVRNIPSGTQSVTGSVTANAGTNLNTSALALDASVSTLNTSVNTLLKPANTLAAVTAVGSITNPISSKTDLTPSAPTAASVGVASASAVAANANRKGLILVNTSANRISLGFGNAAVLDSGPTLYPGGSFEMDEYCFDLGAVNAIASAAASNLAIQEYST